MPVESRLVDSHYWLIDGDLFSALASGEPRPIVARMQGGGLVEGEPIAISRGTVGENAGVSFWGRISLRTVDGSIVVLEYHDIASLR